VILRSILTGGGLAERGQMLALGVLGCGLGRQAVA
jgi:hypothetical protein